MTEDEEDKERAGGLVVQPGTLSELTARIGFVVSWRVPVRVWSMSGVERLHAADGSTVILKYAAPEFAAEDKVLAHAGAHGVPVPRLLASTIQDDGSLVMLMEDLGAQAREATLADAARAAVAVHACPPLPGRPILDTAGLAALPGRALEWLAALRAEGRWAHAGDLEAALTRLARVAPARAHGTHIPPWGMTHSEWHPTSVHIGGSGRLGIVDWARAYTGPGLLDLVSWQGTPEPLDLGAVQALLDAYIAAGGAESAAADRGGRPAHVWAAGWDKVWIVEWFMELAFRRGDPRDDDATAPALLRHLNEAVQCLAD